MRLRRSTALGAGLLLMVSILSASRPQQSYALANGLALTPPMGWNGYNHFGHNVTASLVEAEAREIVSSGMKAAGYQYVNLDGGWNLLQRDAAGNLQPNPALFPDGIKPLADYVHSLGLKFGIYASAGTTNCAGTSAGSYGHYQQDADTFASWGVDYVKFDYCDIPYQDFPGQTDEQVGRTLATQMSQALAATGRPMVFDVNDANAARDHDEDWTWAPAVANLWRVTSDISDSYSSMVSHFDGAGLAAGTSSDVGLYPYAGPGGWNDPDMLEVGNGGMTTTEDTSEFSLWAEMAAPLIAGNDLTAMSAATRSILENREVIAVDQDPLGKQGYPVSSSGGLWVLTKPLADGDRAVLLFNQNDAPAVISTSAAQAGLPPAHSYALRNLWTHSTSETAGPIAATVPPHGVVMYRVRAQPAAAGLYPPQTVLSQSAASAVVPAGQSTVVTSTLTDNGAIGLHQVSMSLQLPSGWSAQPSSPVTFPQVGSGQSVQASWNVTAPAGASPGPAGITSDASYSAARWQGTASGSGSLQVPYPSLAAAFDNAGISDDSDVAAADLDGVGNSYSAEALAAAGLTPGAAVSPGGVSLTWPDVAPGEPDNVVAQGQTILVSGSGSVLGLLGAGSPADQSGTGTVYYTDGTTSTFSVTLDNYFSPPDTGNQIIAQMPYVNDSNPASNGGVAGQRPHTVYLFYTSVPITAGKTVQAVTLPAGGSIPASGRITGIHVFALGVGG